MRLTRRELYPSTSPAPAPLRGGARRRGRPHTSSTFAYSTFLSLKLNCYRSLSTCMQKPAKHIQHVEKVSTYCQLRGGPKRTYAALVYRYLDLIGLDVGVRQSFKRFYPSPPNR